MRAESVKKAAALEVPPALSAGVLSGDEIIIGKDVLELLSSAMYVDPMTIYREYVQNAADAIDEARQQGALGANEPGRVGIEIDAASRSVRIRDNGIAIAWSEFVTRLTALGASAKRGTNARGFRGVGRLAGLGYAQYVIFRSRIAGEALVSELLWDCRKLKTALRAADFDGGVAELIRSIIVARQIDGDNWPERFFEVELRGVVRLRNDKLMNPSAVAEYLSQVAPVPFAPEFRFGSEITAALRPIVELGELQIHVTGAESPVYRPHRNVFEEHGRLISFERLELIEVPGIDGGVGAVAWVLHHSYEGAVPTSAQIKGFRLRSGNIQVGDHTLLEELFPEPRFNVWSVGEIHVIDPRVVPNGRRDHFEQNAHLHNLFNHLTPTARNIARCCRTSSVRRKWLREFQIHQQAVHEKLGIIAQGSLGSAKRNSVALSIEQALLQMDKIAGMDLLVDDVPDALRAIVTNLRADLTRMMREEGSEKSPLARLSPKSRAMYEHLFELVYECSTNRVAAKALIDRILHKLSEAGTDLAKAPRTTATSGRRINET